MYVYVAIFSHRSRQYRSRPLQPPKAFAISTRLSSVLPRSLHLAPRSPQKPPHPESNQQGAQTRWQTRQAVTLKRPHAKHRRSEPMAARCGHRRARSGVQHAKHRRRQPMAATLSISCERRDSSRQPSPRKATGTKNYPTKNFSKSLKRQSEKRSPIARARTTRPHPDSSALLFFACVTLAHSG